MNARSFQAMIPMRDGIRLNTFVFLPNDGGLRWPVIVYRTPYGIAARQCAAQRRRILEEPIDR
jgi:predicted acyl esterase